MAFCTECGADIPADVRFCVSCGAPIKSQDFIGRGGAAEQASFSPSSLNEQAKSATTNGNSLGAAAQSVAVMGTGAYIGTMLLFCIPIVGWLACIIMAFAAKNQNKRNFARAMLVFLIIGIVLLVVLYFVFSWVSEAVMQYINEATEGMFSEFGSLGDLFAMINDAGLSGQ